MNEAKKPDALGDMTVFKPLDPITPMKIARLYSSLSDKRMSGEYTNCDDIFKALALAYKSARQRDHDKTRFWIHVVICLLQPGRKYNEPV